MSTESRVILAELLTLRAALLAPLDQRIADLRGVVQAEDDALLLADAALSEKQRAALLGYSGSWDQRHIGAGLTIEQVFDDPRNEPGYYTRIVLTERGIAIRAALLRLVGRTA